MVSFDVCNLASIDFDVWFDRDNAIPLKTIQFSLNEDLVHTVNQLDFGAGDPLEADPPAPKTTYTLNIPDTDCVNTVTVRGLSGGATTNEYAFVVITGVTEH